MSSTATLPSSRSWQPRSAASGEAWRVGGWRYTEDLAGLLPDLDWVDEQWCLLLFEFWLYALRRPAVRERIASLQRDFRGRLAALLEPLATRELPAHEIASVVIALYQGLSLQRHTDERAAGPDLVTRLLQALESPAAARSRPRQSGTP